MTGSHSRMTRPMSCSTRRNVVPDVFRARTCRSIVATIAGLTPAVGSSSSTSAGSLISRAANSSNFRCPYDSSAAGVSRCPLSPNSASSASPRAASRALSRRPASARQSCPAAADMFSSTVNSPKTRGCWKVRDSPRRYSRPGSGRVTGRPSKTNWPESAGRWPVTRLNTVVFPDPLGPISPVIVERRTAKEQPSTAVTPPNRLVRARTSSSGGPLMPAPRPVVSGPAGWAVCRAA